MKNLILGISAYYHDSAAAIIEGGRLIAAAQEERFTRKKHDPSFPLNAAAYVMEEAGADAGDIAAVSFYEKPILKFERLLETYHYYSPAGLRSFMEAMPVWIKEKAFMRSLINRELEKAGIQKKKILFPEHHLSHAASAFYPSPFSEAAILTVDGVGEWATAAICHGRGRSIEKLREMDFPNSLGLLYSAFTYFLGFRVNSGEYKLMGLAPYGNPYSKRTADFEKKIEEELIEIKKDGSFVLNMKNFGFASGLRMVDDKKWESIFGIRKRPPESRIEQEHADMALAVQKITEKAILLLAGTARDLTGSENLVMAGGVALNCTANGKLLREKIFRRIWVQPASGDAGGALGAALAAEHIYRGISREVSSADDGMKGSYLGPEYSSKDIIRTAGRFEAPYRQLADQSAVCRETASLLSQGRIIGWFQGRMEWGPRSLGNRSILADPRSSEMQKRLNLKIKKRESFRPFAPAVLEEDAAEYFNMEAPSPYMLFTFPVKEKRRTPLPEDYHEREIEDKLYFLRSDIPAVTHLDHSARVQTVSRRTNERFHELLMSFKNLTGCPVLINTSFNVRGEPIVMSPDDAFRCFMSTDMDHLVMGDFLFSKNEQKPVGKEHHGPDSSFLD